MSEAFILKFDHIDDGIKIFFWVIVIVLSFLQQIFPEDFTRLQTEIKEF